MAGSSLPAALAPPPTIQQITGGISSGGMSYGNAGGGGYQVSPTGQTTAVGYSGGGYSNVGGSGYTVQSNQPTLNLGSGVQLTSGGLQSVAPTTNTLSSQLTTASANAPNVPLYSGYVPTYSSGTTGYQPPTQTTAFSPYTTPSKENDYAPTSIFGKIGEDVKTLFVASPLGALVALPEKYNIERTNSRVNVLPFSEAQAAIRGEKAAGANSQWASNQIAIFNMKSNIIGATNEENYYNFQQGRTNLAAMGITTSDVTLPSGQAGISFKSPLLTPSKTTFDYQYETAKTPFQKDWVVANKFITKVTETDLTFFGAELTGIPGAIGRGLGYLGTTGKVAGYIGGAGLIGAYGVGKVNEYVNAQNKPLFWAGVAGEVVGAGTYLETAGYGVQYKNFEVTKPSGEIGNVRTIYAGSKPLITQDVTGKVSLGFSSKTNPFGNTFPEDIYGSKIGASFANKYVSTIPFENPAMGDVVTQGYSHTAQLRRVNYKGSNMLDLTKSENFQNFNPAAKRVAIDFFKSEGESSTGVKGFFNAILNKNRAILVSYGSSSSVSQGALNRPFEDFDIQFSGKGMPKAEDLFAKLNAAQPNTFSLAKDTSLIEMKTPSGTNVHIFDIHGIDTPAQGMASETPLGFKSRPPTKLTIEGQKIPASTVGQEATNKGASVLQFSQSELTGKTVIGPPEHRTKDIADWANILESLNKQAGKKAIDLAPFKSSLGKAFPGTDLTSSKEIAFSSNVISSKGTSQSIGLGSTIKVFSPSSSSSKSSIISPSVSPSSISKSLSLSPSVSYSLSPSISPSTSYGSPYSPSLSLSPSLSPSPSRSLSPSISPSISLSPSPSKSPSPSPSPSPYSPSIYPPTFLKPNMGGEGSRREFVPSFQPKKYTPSFAAGALNLKTSSKILKSSMSGVTLRPIIKPFKTKSSGRKKR